MDKKDHKNESGIERLGTTSPLEVRAALGWAMTADSSGKPLKKPDVVSFDVTSAYLNATINNSKYYVSTQDPELLETIFKINE